MQKQHKITAIQPAKPAFIEPMLCHTLSSMKDLRSIRHPERFVAEPKFDGERALVFIENYRTAACYSRLANDQMNKAGCKWLKDVRWPMKQAICDSELCSDGGVGVASKDAASARSWAGLEKGMIIFDVLSVGGASVMRDAWKKRRAKLEGLFRKFKHPAIAITPVSYEPKLLWKEWVEQRGGEGIVFKDSESPYEPGKRTWTWLKLKNEITVDVVITGTTATDTAGNKLKRAEAELTYGFYSPAQKKVVMTGQGIGPRMMGKKTDLEKYVGKVAEVVCHGVMSKGGLRSAQFKRWRADKAVKECVMPGME